MNSYEILTILEVVFIKFTIDTRKGPPKLNRNTVQNHRYSIIAKSLND